MPAPIRLLVVAGTTSAAAQVGEGLTAETAATAVPTTPAAVADDVSATVDCVLWTTDEGLDELAAVASTGDVPVAVVADLDGPALEAVLATDAADVLTVAVDDLPAETVVDRVRTVVGRCGDAFTDLFWHADDAVFVLDPPADDILRANPAAADVLGYDLDAVSSLAISDVHPDEMERFQGFVDGLDGSDVVETDELTCTTRAGDRIPVEVSATRIWFEGQAAVLAIARDVSERRSRAAVLSALNDAARDLMAAQDPAAAVDVAVTVADTELDLSLAHAHLVAGDDERRLGPVAQTSAMTDAFGALPSFEPGDGVIWEAYADGQPVFMADAAEEAETVSDLPIRAGMVLPLGDHGVLGVADETPGAFDDADRHFASLLANLTTAALDSASREDELRRNEAELEATVDRLDAFASVVAHDLRNPLTVARGNLDADSDAIPDETFDAVSGALDRMETIIDDLLGLARSADPIEGRQACSLQQLAGDAWAGVDTVDATFEVETDAIVHGDRTRVLELLENCVRNAVEHAGDDTHVTVGRTADGFYVADDGPGIPPEDRDAVFEYGHTTATDGTGFGLAIVDAIADAHDWTVTVTESENGGARFEFSGVDVE
jgi:PAS domain S-box-containing protein